MRSDWEKLICFIVLITLPKALKVFARPQNTVIRTRVDTIPQPLNLNLSHFSKNQPENNTEKFYEEEVVLEDSDYGEEENDDPLLHADFIAETNLPTEIGMFRLRSYRHSAAFMKSPFSGNEPCVIYSPKHPINGPSAEKDGVPIRVHDQCVTGEVFGSRRCDCRDQLLIAMKYIQEKGGAIIYLQQEGRGIGLANKIAAYSLQDEGVDTVDANLNLGFPDDWRQYGMIPSILKDLGISSIRLLTNNPRKVNKLSSLGIKVQDTIPVVIPEPDTYNRRYLETKRERMDHMNFGDMLSRKTINKTNID